MPKFFAGHVEETVTLPTPVFHALRSWAIANRTTPAAMLAEFAHDAATAIVRKSGGQLEAIAPPVDDADDVDEVAQRRAIGVAERRKRAQVEWAADERHERLAAFGISRAELPEEAESIQVKHFADAIRTLRTTSLLSDRDIGELLGFSSSAIALQRRRLGLEPISSPHGKPYRGRPRSAR